MSGSARTTTEESARTSPTAAASAMRTALGSPPGIEAESRSRGRLVSGTRFVSVQTGDGLENKYDADSDDEPVPEAEALVHPFTDGERTDESEGADRPPVTNTRL